MIRVAIALVVSIFAAAACSAQQNDLAELKLLGKVSAVTETTIETVRGADKMENHLKGKTKYTFNKRGNKTKEEVYDADGSMASRTSYFYSPTGRLEQEDGYNGDGSPDFTNMYAYNQDSDLSSIKVYNGSGSLFITTVCSYDEHGNEKSEANYVPVLRSNKVRNERSNVTTWQRDEQGRPVKEEFYDGDHLTAKTTTYWYDAKGNLAERTTTDNGLALKTTFKYDDKNRQTEETQYDASGSVTMRIATVYDEHDNETEVSSYDGSGAMQNISTYKLTYDKQGNWVKKVETNNERPVGVVVREVVYY